MGKLPSTMQARPARTAHDHRRSGLPPRATLKPRRRRRKITAATITDTKTVPRQLMAFSLTLTQPLVRVWLTEQARRWVKNSSRRNNG